MTSSTKMISRRPIRAILQGASLLALALAAPLHAQDNVPANAGEISESRYFLQMMSQSFDGMEERSHNQTASFGRLRRGDESWVMMDYGDGAMVVETLGNLDVGLFTNTTPTEIALLYDYRTHELSGNSATAAYHNTFVRPLLDRSPALGSDAAWQMMLSPQQLGVDGVAGDAFALELRRTYLTHQGKALVLIEYETPAFIYTSADGQTVVHWAKGAALADPGFGEIYWNASLHRAVGNAAGRDTRPYRLARTMVAVGADGQPLLDPGSVPQLAEAMADYYSEEATAVLPIITAPGALPDQSPLQLAARIDIAASTILENSANQLGEALGSYLGGETGANGGRGFDAAIGYVEAPDKILDALMTVELSAETVSNARLQMPDFVALNQDAQKLVAEGDRLKREVTTLSAYYRTLSQEAKQLQGTLEAGMRNASNYNDFANDPNTGRTLSRLAELEQRAQTALVRAGQLDNGIAINTRARNLIGDRIDDLEQLAVRMRRSGLVQFANSLTDTVAKYKLASPIKGVIGAFDVAGYYGTAQNVGDVSDLDKRYSTTGGVISGVVFDILGIGTAAFSGNVPATIADAVMVGSTRVTDVYTAYQAWEVAGQQQKQAHLETLLMSMKRSNQLYAGHRSALATIAETIDEARDDLAYIDEELGEVPARVDGPINTSDPRWDPVRNQPRTLELWENYYKKHNPGALVAAGINPDAPAGHTGPWPVVTAPAPRPVTGTTRVPSIDDGGPGYPTAGPRNPATTARTTEPTTPQATVLTDQQRADAERERLQQQVQSDLEAYQAEVLANRRAEEEEREAAAAARRQEARSDTSRNEPVVAEEPAAAATGPFALSAKTPFLSPTATSALTVTPLDTKPVTWKPPTWTPVEFDPVTFEPVTWKPPTWTPPEFRIDNPSDIPWTDFDDGEQWGGGVQNLAFDFSGMSGKVATDLEPYAEWLATQDVRQLERLALQAGYPNLASALADFENLIKNSADSGWRAWAMAPPSCNGPAGCGPQYSERWAAKRSRLALGDILQMDREFFSSAGLTDIQIAGLFLAFTIADFGLEDGDIVTVVVNQFGRTLLNQTLTTTNAGTSFSVPVQRGVVGVQMTAVNTGEIPPNTAALAIQGVSLGESDQQYSLETGDTADLRVTVGED